MTRPPPAADRARVATVATGLRDALDALGPVGAALGDLARVDPGRWSAAAGAVAAARARLGEAGRTVVAADPDARPARAPLPVGARRP